ncbi:restriction endonuclease subunit S [Magnetospirillum sulfuroxidans]|uniref:Restriction endonuclease subunit S n=1 Tax=Magnetospirillum sulfuroxidans TaxID=611300 RepID=A0ABS5IE36_9PROT|nr:restriction endonuclease subunit S [Magnetospirillum sulfuroxidans]MBR9972681.1 restriction endonuclease subunit S [Magnetospirillum sulfuroxidans]
MSDQWKAARLGDVICFQRGFDLPARLRQSGGIPIVSSSGISDFHSRAKVAAPVVVTGRYGTIGEVFYVNEYCWPLNTTLFVVDFKGNHPPFVYYILKTIDFKSYSGKSGVPGVNRNDLHEIAVSCPPLDEQKLIASALSDIDELLASLDALIAKKHDLKQAAMQQLLTGRVRSPGFQGESAYKHTEAGVVPSDWVVSYIEEIATISTGGKNTQDRVDGGEFPFFVRSQKVESINSYSFDGEAVLTAGDGVGTGRIFHYINGKFDAHQRVYLITDFGSHVDGYWFYLYFSVNFYNRLIQMTAKSSVDSIRREMIARMPIALPPTKAEQTAIATILSDMDSEITALEARRDKTRALKQGMMQELLSGRIRLL